MRSFFVQIFLAFWVSTLAIFVAATVIFPRATYAYPENLINALRVSMQQLAQLQVTDRRNACDATRTAPLLVLDSEYRDICGKAVPPYMQQLAARARFSQHRESEKNSSLWIVAEPIHDRAGHSFVAVLFTPFHGAGWFPHLPTFAIPVSALVTFLFAYLLTNPVRALRLAFRQFAAGDMTVRLPVARNKLRDWGGADIRTLMIDFNEMADRIQALLEAHKVLLRDVSHELRSPLARLNVALELAREDVDETSTALDRATLESSRLNALIGELLSLSHMETIQDVPQSKTLFLGALIEDLMPDLLFEADTRYCKVIHRHHAGCPVQGSEDVLRRALENVIRNAVRHSPPASEVVVESQTETSREGATEAVVRICDSGPGVPEESLAAIFRPFYRVDSSRQAATGGFGVGLAIADRAVHIHRGSIRAFNRPSGGLCVELRLPCHKVQSPERYALSRL